MPDSSLGQFFSTALKTLGLDAIKVALPILDSTAKSIEANPSVANVLAQKLLFASQMMLQLPNLEAQVIRDLVTQAQADVDALAASASASLQPPTPPAG